MAIHLAGQDADRLYLGTQLVSKAYIGTSLVYVSPVAQAITRSITGIPSTTAVGVPTLTLNDPPPSQTVYMDDPFTGSAGAPWDDTKWDAVPAIAGYPTYELDGNGAGRVVMAAVTGYSQYRRPVHPSVITVDDYQLEWRFALDQASGDIGWLIRTNDAANVYYEFRIQGSSSTGRTRLFRRDAVGTTTPVDVSPGTGFTVGVGYNNKIHIVTNPDGSTRFRYYRWPVGGTETEVFDYTDTASITGTSQRGLRLTTANPSADGLSRTIRIDDVRILSS